MIFVDRSTVAPPPVLTVVGNKGFLETQEAIAFYRRKSKSKSKTFSFDVYKDPSIKKALQQLFHGKCAYCESSYVEIHPVDVEHWRPKAAVEHFKGKRPLPGYYWLAADWNNLLPSCIHCNRASYHLIPPHFDLPMKLGKGNRFPLKDESKRAKKPGDEIHEDPLLLNPCRDRPEDFLIFPLDETRRGIVQARPDRIGKPHYHVAESSIEVYGLNREGLVKARQRRFLEIAKHLKTAERLAKELDEAKDAVARERISNWLKDEFQWLEGYKRPEEPYSQMARQLVDASLSALSR